MQMKASNYLANLLERLEDLTKGISIARNRLTLEGWNNYSYELEKDLTEIGRGFNQLYLAMIKNEFERTKNSEL